MTAIAGDNKIGCDMEFALLRFRDHTGHAIIVAQQIHCLSRLANFELLKPLALAVDEIQEIPLRHEGNKRTRRIEPR